MKLFFAKWKKTGCLAMITILLFMGMKGVYNVWEVSYVPQPYYAAGSREGNHTKQASGGDNRIISDAFFSEIACSTESMLLKGCITANRKPAGVEIYRTKIKGNGKNGKFKKIGSCKEFLEETEGREWSFCYKDNGVKTGTAYAYKYKAYCKAEGEIGQYGERYSQIRKGVAAKTSGQYTCKIIASTKKKLIIKLTGKSRKNGPLEPRFAITDYIPGRADAELRYKNNGENEICRNLELKKFSYDGKKWYTRGAFSIKGKQGVYLYYEELINRSVPWHANNIKVSHYQYVQMLCPFTVYNLQSWKLYPQLRCNLSTGAAAVGDFITWNEVGDYSYVWDGDIFARNYASYD